MNELQEKLLQEARSMYITIYPCGSQLLADCFTVDNDTLLLWFNTEDRSTHMVFTQC